MNQPQNSKPQMLSRKQMISILASAGLGALATMEALANANHNHSLRPHSNTANMNTKLKTIGILGGLGPQATMELEQHLHRSAQNLLPQAENTGYPPMVVVYYRHAPILLTSQNMPATPWTADPRMLDKARQLATMSDFILIPSHGAHLFQNEIEQASGRKVLSLIDVTLIEIKRRGWKNVGPLCLMSPRVYSDRLTSLGIGFERIDESLQQRLNHAIFKTMEGREDDDDRKAAWEAITQLRQKGVDGIIPGCTEIPRLLGDHMYADDIFNPLMLLADAAIKHSMT